jgi:Leucine-rich repeat (LRR) protein
LSKARSGGNDFFRFIVSSSSGASAEIHSATLIVTGVWYHVAAVRGSNFTQIYVNGQLERQTNVSFAQDYGNLPVYFGTTGQSYWDHRFKGNLDEVTIYNRPLSSNEIASIYAVGSGGKCKLPDFALQPQGQTVSIGGTAAFTVTATGVTPLFYQWRLNGTNLAGATTNTLTIANAQSTNSGDYTVVVTNSLGSATSAVATLVVLTVPSIAGQPASRTNLAGTTATFNVTANGSPPLSYQWLFFGTALPNSTTSSLVLNGVQPPDAGDYSVIVSNSAGSITSVVATLTVYVPPSIDSQPQSRTNISGTSANFIVSATGTLPLTYQWRLNGANLAGATDAILTIANVQPANAGSYTVVVTNVGGSITSAVASLIVWVPPSISAPPQSRTNIAGTTASFGVTANGTSPLSYQWQFNGASLAGATASTLNLTSVQSSDAGNYSVIITNSAGAITSGIASLTVWVPPAFSSQPQSRTNVSGSPASFSVIATGTLPLSYQWRLNAVSLAGATNSVLNLTNVQPADAGDYSVIVTNVGGSATSALASLTVWVPPSISTQPQSLINIAGTDASFNVAATGTTPLAYQWQVNGAILPGATANSLILSNVQPVDAGNYAVVVTNVAGSITSSVASLTVYVPPSITAPPQSRTNIAGTTATFSVGASGTTPFSYQWQFNGANLTGATASSLALANVQPPDTGNYTVVVTNAGGSITSSIASLTVWVPPSITLQPLNRTNLAGTIATFSVSASGTTPFAYQWLFGGANLAGATSSSFSITNVQPADAGNYSVIVTNFGGSITSALASLTVWVPPAIIAQPQNRTNIAGTTADFSVTVNGTTPFSFQWQFNGANLSGATASSLSLTNVQPADAGNYSVVVTNFGGSVTSSIASLTIWVPPSISSQPQSRTNIAGTIASFSVVANGTTPFSYQWQLNGGNLSGATGATFSITNVQPAAAGNYSVIVTNFGGSITSSIATLTIWVPPAITLQPLGSTNILGTSASFTGAASGTAPLSYQWQFNGAGITGATSNTLNFDSVDYTNSGNYTLVVTNVAGSVTSSVAILLVIEPQTVLVCDPNLDAALRRELAKPSGNLNRNDLRGLTSLRAPDSHIASLCGLEWATNLTLLYLGGNLVSDLSPLTNFSRLKTLFVYHNQLSDLSPIAGLTNLTYLDVRANPGVTNFDAVVPQLSGLTNLFLGNNSLSNITFVAALPGLKFLGLDNNSITNLSPLAALTNLTGLDLSYNSLTNLSQVSAIASPNLTTLHVSGNAVTNVAALAALPQLKELSAYALRMVDFTPLAALTNLTALNLGGNPDIVSYSSMGVLTNLSCLWFEGNDAATLDFLAPLSQLKLLDLDKNRVQDLAPLSSLAGLSSLSVAANQLTNITPLSTLTNLATLQLANNFIADISPLTGLARLKDLGLRNNALKSVPSLAAPLDSLDLGQNTLTNFSSLSGFGSLSHLRLDSAGLSDATFLQPLALLTFLDLGNNSISDPSPLTVLSNLTSLNLQQNLIASPSVLGSSVQLASLNLSFNPVISMNFLSKLTNLTELYLEGNSLPNTDFLKALTNLNILDLSQNRLTNCAFVTNFTALHSFLAGNNRLTDLAPLTSLPQLWLTDVRTNLLDLSPGSAPSAVIDLLTNRQVVVYSLPQNQAPSILISSYWPVAANATSPPLLFSVLDDVTPAAQLLVTAVSSNTALIPNSGISVTITNSGRSLVVTPAPGQTGNDIITLTVTDDTGLSTNAHLLVAVIPAQAISIPDPNLRSAVRNALSKPSGALSNVDMLLLNQLSASYNNVSNISGLEWASNLTTLTLSGNFITNLAPLRGLSGLSSLSLDLNLVSDISPLVTLTNLGTLQLNNNLLTNIISLQSLFALNLLNLNANDIADISPLAGLTNLNTLFLRQNLLTNIIAIQNLPNLFSVDLSVNLLDLHFGTLASAVIQTLQSRAVAVIYLPQRPGPDMSLPSNWAIPANAFSILPFTIRDSVFPPATLTLSVTSADSSLLPAANLLLNSDNTGNWTLRATPVPGELGSTTITFIARNPAGLTSTQAVPVFVVSPQPFAGAALNNTNLDWNTWGYTNWFIETAITHDGLSAAQSGAITDNQESWLGTTIVGPGHLSWWWKVSSEFRFDFLELYVNGVLQSNRISGEVDWQLQNVDIPPGTNTFRWRYAKDKDTSAGLDAAWLDEVSFIPGTWLEIDGPPTNNQVSLVIHAVPGNLYELQVSSNLLTWSRLAVVTPTNSAYLFLDTSAIAGPRFYRLHELPLGSIFFDRPSLPANSIKLVLHSPPDLRFNIQISTNLSDWNSLLTLTNVSGTVTFTNSLVTNNPRLFFRAKLLF